jgi:uncharacterized membrane protein YfcA
LIDWRTAREFIGGGFLGGIIGTLLANHLGKYRSALDRIFAGLIFVVAGYVLWRSGRDLLFS